MTVVYVIIYHAQYEAFAGFIVTCSQLSASIYFELAIRVDKLAPRGCTQRHAVDT